MIDLIWPSSCFISTLSSFSLPFTSLIEYLVKTSIFFSFSNSFIFSTLEGAPLNSSLLWINVTFEFFESSIAQSKALSPPPKITTFLSLKMFLSLIEYKTAFSSNFSQFFVGNFLGSKEPTPPAITIFGVINSFPFSVFTIHSFVFLFLEPYRLNENWN